MAYQTILSPGRIGSLEIRNRTIVTAMGVNFAEEGGFWGDRILAFHEEQAHGGVGMIISGACGVMYPIGQVQEWQLALSDDKYIPGLKKVVAAVHNHGACFAVQLHQGGLNAVDDTVAGRPQWCPSVPAMKMGDFVDGMLLEELQAFAMGGMPTYRVMDQDDISAFIRAFADGARRAKEAGCDAVEVHGGHGYVLSSFLSPVTNQREDEYGGSLENRARLLLETVRAVRDEVGPEFPVIVKIDSREVGKDGGVSLEDATTTAQWLEKAGADAITVSAYHDTSKGKMHSASNIPHQPNTNLPAAETIRAAISIPVIALGRVEPEHADREIARGAFDFLAMGRKLLADPHLPRKLAEGKAEQIRPCIYCYTCVSAIYTRTSTRCAVNAECGLEYQRKNAPVAPDKKRVAVVGGGPGGMEASRRLADAGHEVILLEKSARLGGTLRFASIAYQANEGLLDWLCLQLESRDIDVRLNTTATAELLNSLSLDEVVVATGALRTLPSIPGSDQAHVFSGDDMRDMVLGSSSERLKEKTSLFTRMATKIGAATGITANLDIVRKATRAWMPLGENIVVIGGELVGIELAEFLCERGRKVTVVDDAPKLGKGLTLVRRLRILAELREHGVNLCRGAKDIVIGPSEVQFVDEAGENRVIPADQVIVAKGATGDSSQAEAFSSAGLRVHEIGDGTGVGYIEGAMRDAMAAVDAINAS